jgi:hypothetical protein
MRTISQVCQRICAHQNEPFETVNGKPFTCTVSGNVLRTSRPATTRRIWAIARRRLGRFL